MKKIFTALFLFFIFISSSFAQVNENLSLNYNDDRKPLLKNEESNSGYDFKKLNDLKEKKENSKISKSGSDVSFKFGNFGASLVDSTGYVNYKPHFEFFKYTKNEKYDYWNENYVEDGFSEFMLFTVDVPIRMSPVNGAFFGRFIKDFKDFDKVSAAKILETIDFEYFKKDGYYILFKENSQLSGETHTGVTTGFGSIMNSYFNSRGFDDRRNGLFVKSYNLPFEKKIPVEVSLYTSDITSRPVVMADLLYKIQSGSKDDVYGVSYRRSQNKINFYAEATYAGDFNEFAGVTRIDTVTGAPLVNNGSINIVGGNLLAEWVRDDFNLGAFADVTKIFNFGNEWSIGALFNFAGALSQARSIGINFKFNRFQTSERFISGYFNSNYEIDRYNVSQNSNGAYILNSKALTLDRVLSSTSGYNIGLKILIQDNNRISGDNFKGDFLLDIGYKLNELDSIGNEFNIFMSTPLIFDRVKLNGKFNKTKIQKNQLFAVNENTFVQLEILYKLAEGLALVSNFKQAFTPVYNSQSEVINFTRQKNFDIGFKYIPNF